MVGGVCRLKLMENVGGEGAAESQRKFQTHRKSLNSDDESIFEVVADRAPTGTMPPAEGWPVGRETCPLSLRMVIILASR